MLQIVIVVVIVVMMVAVVADTVWHAIRSRSSSVLLPGAGWRYRASRVSLQELVDRESMLVHWIRRHVLHLRALL